MTRVPEYPEKDLKPCPKCRSNNVYPYRFMQVAATNKQIIVCAKCGHESSVGNSKIEAIEIWNEIPRH